MSNIIERLITAHQRSNRELRRELARIAPDAMLVRDLKKRRLAIKDRLVRYVPDAAEMRRVARIALGRPAAAV